MFVSWRHRCFDASFDWLLTSLQRMISGPLALPQSSLWVLSSISRTACLAYLISLLFASTLVLAQVRIESENYAECCLPRIQSLPLLPLQLTYTVGRWTVTTYWGSPETQTQKRLAKHTGAFFVIFFSKNLLQESSWKMAPWQAPGSRGEKASWADFYARCCRLWGVSLLAASDFTCPPRKSTWHNGP